MSNVTFSYSGTVANDDDGTVIDTQAFAGNNSRPGVNPEHIGVSRAVSDCQIFKFGSGGQAQSRAGCHLAVWRSRDRQVANGF